jgi:hypothetical protein
MGGKAISRASELKSRNPSPSSEPDTRSPTTAKSDDPEKREDKAANQLLFKPQKGPQTKFMQSRADIAIYGGAAGGGKTWALLLQPIKHSANPEFSAVFFRRSTVQVRNPGALWDESFKLYPGSGAEPFTATLEWKFPSGAKVKFAHLEYDKTVLEWQGAQLPLICFDELTHFTAAQFWSMTARNRSVGTVTPYIRATCNPDADSWVAELVAWWIDPETGLPIEDRSAQLRWFVRVGDRLEWAGAKTELEDQHPGLVPRSLTFVAASLKDNKALTSADPEYRAKLLALPRVERERLLYGNWKIRAAAGLLFNRAWCPVVDAAPAGLAVKRGWDLAATPKTETNDPDWTLRRQARPQPGRPLFRARPPPPARHPRRGRALPRQHRRRRRRRGRDRPAAGPRPGRQVPGRRPRPRPGGLHRESQPRERRQGHPLRPLQRPGRSRQRLRPPRPLERRLVLRAGGLPDRGARRRCGRDQPGVRGAPEPDQERGVFGDGSGGLGKGHWLAADISSVARGAVRVGRLCE